MATTTDRRNDPRPPSQRADDATRADVGARSFLRKLGPGLITGAADDDPSGIATYSQAGAAFGFGLLWTALICLPLMATVQLMCARIGLVSKSGLASALRDHYPRWLLWTACALLVVGNTVNIAADLSGMAAAAAMLSGVSAAALVPVFAVAILALLVYASYERMTQIFKWMTLALFAYIVAAFLAHPHWGAVLRGTVIPQISTTQEYLLTFVAILGTTISPYLFFWQAAQTAEQEQHIAMRHPYRRRRALGREIRDARLDTWAGMIASQVIMYFIILTAGATLHAHGVTDVETAAQAAAALKPVAGALAYWLFAFGLVGTGMLGVPVLAGSAAYAVSEAAGWERGMDEKPHAAKEFYGVMAIAMLIGTLLALLHINAIRLLLWSAVANGVLAPPLIVIILLVCNNDTVMGEYRNGRTANVLGWIAAVLMTAAAIAMIVSFL
jgi:NRAMP (natural resistance-associated macrophage protein)-like metal ion transporter